MLRHYPWNERECFIASGSSFFPAQRTLELNEGLTSGPPYKGYKYSFEDAFLGSTIAQTTKREEVMLKVWEPPEEQGVYVIGGDPSGGGGGDANDHALEVFRCYADRLVQVAEFQSNRPLTYQFAWVLAHLCGAYKEHIANIEVVVEATSPNLWGALARHGWPLYVRHQPMSTATRPEAPTLPNSQA